MINTRLKAFENFYYQETKNKLHKHQKQWFKAFTSNANNLIVASRQSGKTEFLINYCKFLLTEDADLSIAFICHSEATAIRIRSILKNYLNVGVVSSDSRTSLYKDYDFVVMDDAAFFKNAENIFISYLIRSDKINLISSSNLGSYFNKLALINKQNKFIKFISNFIPSLRKEMNVLVTPYYNYDVKSHIGKQAFEVNYNCKLE